MKILHITAMSPLSPNSGIPKVLKELSFAQNKLKGVESIVLSLKGRIDCIDSPYFVYLGNRSIEDFLCSFGPDVVILHSFFHVEYISVARVLVKNNIRFFVEPHGSFGIEAMKKSHIKKLIANNTIFREQIKRSYGYIFTNEEEQKTSIYRTINDLIIPNGVMENVVKNAKNKAPLSFKYPSFYYLGRYDINHKGLDYLFDALDIIESKKIDIKVNFYGTGNKKGLGYVQKRLSNYVYIEAEDNGPIYGDKKKNALENNNILLLTSRYEGSPMTVLDGLSYGNPVLATPGTNVADTVNENKIGWRAELDAEKIADKIIEARSEYIREGEKIVERCKAYVMTNCNWDKIASLSIEMLNKVE